MRRVIVTTVTIAAVTALAALLSGCVGGKRGGVAVGGAAPLSLDEAIAEAAAKIEGGVEHGAKAAFLNFESPSDAFSMYFMGETEARLVASGKLTVVDRRDIDLIGGEMAFQMSGAVSDETIRAAGRKLGAQFIITGQLIDVGGAHRVSVRVVNIETAALMAQYRSDIGDDGRVQSLLAQGRRTAGSMGEVSRESRAARDIDKAEAQDDRGAAAPIADARVKTAVLGRYKIGDTGPAGGLVFYDKGDDSDGWRYMEAAPQTTEKMIAWWGIVHDAAARVEDTGVGAGLDNTRKIIEYLKTQYGPIDPNGCAACYCDALEYGGFKDWFLPSLDELEQMRNGLYANNIGGLQQHRVPYWASNVRRRNILIREEVGHSLAYHFGGSSVMYSEPSHHATNKFAVRAIRRFK